MNGCPNCGEGKCAQCYPTRKISELERLRASETRLREGLRELADSVKELIDWMPTCSVGGSGFMRRMAVKEKLAALLSLEGDKRT